MTGKLFYQANDSSDIIRISDLTNFAAKLNFSWQETITTSNNTVKFTTQTDQQPDLLIKYVNDTIGHVVLAHEDIKCGQFVCMYAGKLRNSDDHSATTQYTHALDIQSSQSQLVVDAEQAGNIARFLPHLPYKSWLSEDYIFTNALDSNQIATCNLARAFDPNRGIIFSANRDIKTGEAIGYDYGFDFWLQLGKKPLLMEKNATLLPEKYYHCKLIAVHCKIETLSKTLYMTIARENAIKVTDQKSCCFFPYTTMNNENSYICVSANIIRNAYDSNSFTVTAPGEICTVDEHHFLQSLDSNNTNSDFTTRLDQLREYRKIKKNSTDKPYSTSSLFYQKEISTKQIINHLQHISGIVDGWKSYQKGSVILLTVEKSEMAKEVKRQFEKLNFCHVESKINSNTKQPLLKITDINQKKLIEILQQPNSESNFERSNIIKH